ncbi:hypothetical protein [Yersinia phage MHG19]|nr:hypothetical protein [Yersinia phage MHG19]
MRNRFRTNIQYVFASDEAVDEFANDCFINRHLVNMLSYHGKLMKPFLIVDTDDDGDALTIRFKDGDEFTCDDLHRYCAETVPCLLVDEDFYLFKEYKEVEKPSRALLLDKITSIELELSELRALVARL